MNVTADEVNAWIAADPDERTRTELTELVERAAGTGEDALAAQADLDSRFSGPLEFGTAGLRGALGGGPHRMNRAVVIRAAAGLSDFLAGEVGRGFTVAVGYDARYGSAQFARDTAAVVTAAGGRALLLPEPLPTPVLAFAVRHLGTDAGVMVTASHNPPQDNGYKVYLGGRAVTGAGQGAQIVPPYDARIAERIAAAPRAVDVPLAEGGWEVLGPEIHEAYLQRVVSLVPPRHTREVRIVYTPMHGVGGATTVEALRRAGFGDVHVVPKQADPDPDFPTVAFPNPEEPGALDLAFDLARSVDADLVLANDPDADRCTMAVPDRNVIGGWRQLTGDEIGALLGEQTGVAAAFAGRGVLASSVVSSRLLARIAQAHGLQHRTTLTGFKWIARTEGLVFGYEEAIGYCVDPAAVRDKDGISAAVRIAYLAAQLNDHGETFVGALDNLAQRHGVHETSQISVRVSDLSLITSTMARLRSGGPTTLAGSPVVTTTDLATGSEDLPPTDGLLYLTAAGDRVIIRPSGTEPKLKCYLEVIVPSVPDVSTARHTASLRMEALRADVAAAVEM
ncbi:phosphomannomutase [Georgenia soli]|uniref:Phosphomannomutase n=1 Tax=Georgenia soli TaxID=638953 RepID=A0A2A9ENA2_9MICO|nr:phospho-sugar mutase [Georgenia soli]PFG40567.1 phosphomannomutase [Georgenia soli]